MSLSAAGKQIFLTSLPRPVRTNKISTLTRTDQPLSVGAELDGRHGLGVSGESELQGVIRFLKVTKQRNFGGYDEIVM